MAVLRAIKSFFKREIAFTEKPKTTKNEEAGNLRVATCALLLEMAHADDAFTEVELTHIIETMKNHFSLSKEASVDLIRLADEERKNSIDLWQFTHLIKHSYSVEQKANLIEMIWKVIYVDGTLDQYEDYLVHKLATLLGLEHKQLIGAKMKVLNENRKTT
jgi:uncharacterized tellurite resistance protein B-like protein